MKPNINIEKEAANIQKLPLKPLRKVVKSSELLLKNDDEIHIMAEEIDTFVEIEHSSTQTQDMSLQQLKILLKTPTNKDA
jgi:hypothetical protein